MARLTINPFDGDAVSVSAFERDRHPAFQQVFETHNLQDELLRLFARSAEEAELGVVVQNETDKPISAMQYLWTTTDGTGRLRPRRCAVHSYGVAVYHPTLQAHDQMLITPSGSNISASILAHAASGGGVLGGRVESSLRGQNKQSADWTFDLSVVIFEDGEIVGPDTHQLVARLHCQQRAAEYIDEQIRIAAEQGRDVRPVLEGHTSFPLFNHEIMAEEVRRQASMALHAPLGRISRASMKRVPLPKFYRREKT